MGCGGIGSIVRITVSAIIAVLGVLGSYYPSNLWVIMGIAVAGTLGVHVVPAVTQKGFMMSEPFPAQKTETAPELENPIGVHGSTLMGFTPQTIQAVTDVQQDVTEVRPADQDVTEVRTSQGAAQTEPGVTELLDYLKAHQNLLLSMAASFNANAASLSSMADGLAKLIDT